MARALTARNAIINTASMSVKTLTIEAKQVTLAVFRQLIEEPIFDWHAMALRGVGWGHVRYLIDEPPDVAIHLVWQRGDDLRRCILFRRKQREGLSPAALLAEPLMSYRGNDMRKEVIGLRLPVMTTPWGKVMADIPQSIEVAREARHYVLRDADPERYDKIELANAERARKIAEYRDAARAAYAPLLDDIVERYETYNRLVTPLFDLPQLFIAV